MSYSNQDLRCAICHSQEHETTLEEMGIIGSKALTDALEAHKAHTKKESTRR